MAKMYTARQIQDELEMRYGGRFEMKLDLQRLYTEEEAHKYIENFGPDLEEYLAYRRERLSGE